MYAVIATGGKQYRVEEEDLVRVEKLDAEPGESVTFDQVLAIRDDSGIKVGDDVSGSTVTATVMDQDKAKKVVVYKYKPKKGYHKKNGHRQPYTLVKIDSIKA